ncbi:MAG: hypothetical protein SGI77_14590 [Pirellulaceae bacterium]|nr:hypothetical protein [Pirellulaceae bacterium]
MPSILNFIAKKQITLLVAALLIFTDDSLAQQPNLSNAGPSALNAPSNGTFVGTITDPRTGKQYDRYWEQENVPMPRWEQQEITERLSVPQWVTETIKTTETQYVPYIEYQVQQRVVNRWNPFGQPQVTWEYVPVTRYQAIPQVVDKSVTYQKYVEQDVKRVVPKLVQSTQSVGKYVDRERTATNSPQGAAVNTVQNAAELAMANRNSQIPHYPTRPMDAWYNGNPYSGNPYRGNLASNVATPSWSNPTYPSIPTAPYYGATLANSPAIYPGGASPILSMPRSPIAQTQLVSNQSIVPPVPGTYSTPTYPAYQASLPPMNAYSMNQSLFQWPSWSSNNGPLFRQDLFRQDRTSSYGMQPTAGTIYPTIASQNSVGSYLRPTSSPMLPQPSSSWGNFGGGSNEPYRDPLQSGLPPTVLR